MYPVFGFFRSHSSSLVFSQAEPSLCPWPLPWLSFRWRVNSSLAPPHSSPCKGVLSNLPNFQLEPLPTPMLRCRPRFRVPVAHRRQWWDGGRGGLLNKGAAAACSPRETGYRVQAAPGFYSRCGGEGLMTERGWLRQPDPKGMAGG